jgi:hypothetical protein
MECVKSRPLRFALLDDHPTVVAGVEQFISSSGGAKVIWRGGNPGELEPLPEDLDYLIGDLLLGMSDAFPFLQRVRMVFSGLAGVIGILLGLLALH